MGEHDAQHQRHQEGAGGNAHPAGDDRPDDGERQGLGQRQPGDGGEPDDVVRRMHRRHAEQAGHDRGDDGHQHDPQILHEGDQPRVGAVVLGHDGHHRGGPRAGAPQRRRAGHHLPARHQPAEQARDDDDQHDAGAEQHPVAQHVVDDRQRHHAGDQAADDALGQHEGRQRERHLAARGATTMPAISGPSIRAAGAWIHSRKAAMPADRAISTPH